MSIMFPTKLLKQIADDVSTIAPNTNPRILSYQLETGSSTVLQAPSSSKMMMYVKGGIPEIEGETITLEFSVLYDGEYYGWSDGSGNIVELTLGGHEKMVIGPVEVPSKGGYFKVEEKTAVSEIESWSIDETADNINTDIIAIDTDTYGNIYIANQDGVVAKYNNELALQWTCDTEKDMNINGGIAIDNLGNIYTVHTDGYIKKISNEGVVLASELVPNSNEGNGIGWYDGYVYVTTKHNVADEHFLTKVSDISLLQGSTGWQTSPTVSANTMKVNKDGVYTLSGTRLYKISLQNGLELDRYELWSGGIAYTIALNDAGEILVVGYSTASGQNAFALRRLTSSLESVYFIEHDMSGDVLNTWGRFCCFDNVGNAYVSTFNWAGGEGHPIYKINPSGTEVTLIPNTATRTEAFYYVLATFANKIYFCSRYADIKRITRTTTVRLDFVEY